MLNIGLLEKEIENNSKLLNILLADCKVAQQAVQKVHWRLTGVHFQYLHELTEKLYQHFDIVIDLLAERIRQLNQQPVATLAAVLQTTTLTEHSNLNDSTGYLDEINDNYNAIIKAIRTTIKHVQYSNDYATSNLLETLIEQFEQKAWFIRNHLEQ